MAPLVPERNEEPAAKKTVRITNEKKQACFKFFDEHDYSVNSKLPRSGSEKATALALFMSRQDLSRSQIKTQLQNWKQVKFFHYGSVFEKDPDKLRQQITAGMPTSNTEFITEVVIENILTKSGMDGLLVKLNPDTQPFLQFMQKKDGSPFVQIFSRILDKYIEYLVDAIPSQARLCAKHEELFEDRRDALIEKELSTFLLMIESFEFPGELRTLKTTIDEELWKLVFFDLETKLFHYWTRERFLADRKPIVIATECVVSKFALAMVYFTAGVLLRKIANAMNTKFKSRGKISEDLSKKHNIGRLVAKSKDLPIRICDARQKRGPVYASEAFFSFVKKVESTFVMNATTEMMISYCDGSLFEAIKEALAADTSIYQLFKNDLELSNHDDEDIKKLLIATLTIYRNIRGRWFVNRLKAQRTAKTWSTRENVRLKTEAAIAKNEAISSLKFQMAAAEDEASRCELESQVDAETRAVRSQVALDELYEDAMAEEEMRGEEDVLYDDTEVPEA